MRILERCAAGALATIMLAPLATAETRVVMLGTGTPVPDHTRAGSGLAVVHDGQAFLFDAGGGVVQRMIEASATLGIDALYPTNLTRMFLTHLHSDHTLDYSELAATYWWRRESQLRAWGPTGLQSMTDAYYDMQATDIDLRISGNQPVRDPDLYRVDVTEIAEPGTVYDQDGVTVDAFLVNHGDIEPAFGYVVTTPDGKIVISGDTAFSEGVQEAATGADILIHEVISEEGWSALPEDWQAYHRSSHTLTSELSRLASEAEPGLLVLTHVLFYGASIETALTEVEAQYDGRVVLADDLDVFELPLQD